MVEIYRDIKVKIDPGAFEIGGYLLLEGFEEALVADGGWENAQEAGLCNISLRNRQSGLAEGGICGCQGEIAPFCVKDGISYGWLHRFR